MKNKTMLVGGIVFFLILTACSNNSDQQTNAAEQTLQAIYAQQTNDQTAEQSVAQTVAALNAQQAYAQNTADAQTLADIQSTLDALTAQTTPQTEPQEQQTTSSETEETQTEADTPSEITHTLIPAEPGWVDQWLDDTNSINPGLTSNAVINGDLITSNIYERPLTTNDMQYQPYLDITRVEISNDDFFYYITIYLSGTDENNLLTGTYGVEFDTNNDGGGDYLLWAKGTNNTQWSIDNVYLYKDYNQDVGGYRPMNVEFSIYTGDSYESLIFSPNHLTDPDVAWIRLKPTNAKAIQFAVKKEVISTSQIFMWSAWADGGVADPAKFDYNDTFTQEQAGSPYANSYMYPLKELYSVDSTCRLPFGFEPQGDEPGVCYYPKPTATLVPIIPTKGPTPVSCDCSLPPNQITNQACCDSCPSYWWNAPTSQCLYAIY